MHRILWAALPASPERPRFHLALVSKVRGFASGYFLSNGLGALVANLDKLVLSALLPLNIFGYYILASTVAGCLWVIITPVIATIFPRFTQLVALDDRAGIVSLYHRSCQFMAVLVLPAAAIIAVFSRDVLLVWTGNPLIADNAHTLVALLVIGIALSGLASVPIDLAVAYGWIRLVVYSNMTLLILLVPGMVWMVTKFGVEGAAYVWIVLHAFNLLIVSPLVHFRYLRREFFPWFANDVGIPAIVVTLFAAGAYWYTPDSDSRLAMFATIATSWLLLFAITVLATPRVRAYVAERIL